MDTSVYLDNSDETASLYRQRAELQAEAARLREALTAARALAGEALQQLTWHCKHDEEVIAAAEWLWGFWDGNTIVAIPGMQDDAQAAFERLMNAAIEAHSVTQFVTDRENDKQPCAELQAELNAARNTIARLHGVETRLRARVEAARAEGAAAEQERACKAICSMCRNDDPILKDGHWIHFRPNVGPGGICSQWCRAAAIRSAEAEEAQE